MIDQTIHEHQVSAPVSTLSVVSVAHREENLLSPNVVTQANSVYTKLEQDSSVSCWYNYVLAVTDVWQAEQSMLGVFANARNVLITGGTIVRLCFSYVCDFYTYSMNRMFSLLVLVESR